VWGRRVWVWYGGLNGWSWVCGWGGYVGVWNRCVGCVLGGEVGVLGAMVGVFGMWVG
jgi:hypothetical protein